MCSKYRKGLRTEEFQRRCLRSPPQRRSIGFISFRAGLFDINMAGVSEQPCSLTAPQEPHFFPPPLMAAPHFGQPLCDISTFSSMLGMRAKL
jgi:hypothetical protein